MIIRLILITLIAVFTALPSYAQWDKRGGGSITGEDEGISLGAFTILDAVGAGITASFANGQLTLTVPGGGSATFTVEENDVEVSSVVTILNFLGVDFDLAESPSGQVQIVIAAALARDSELHDAMTVSGTPNYITISGQDLIRGLIDLATDVTGLLPTANIVDEFLRNNAADEMLLADATTNVVTDVLDISHTGGVVAAGFGSGIRFDLEDAGGIEEQASLDVFLEVVTEGAEEASITFRHNVAGTIQESMRIDGTSGFVGIGTATPANLLEVSNATGDARAAVDSDTDDAILRLDAGGGTGDISGLDFRDLGTTIWGLRMDNLTRDLIMTDVVNGGIAVMTFEDGASANSIFVESGGQIGIGNAAPGSALDVTGRITSTSLAISAAIPFLLTNGQLVDIALTSQTVGATTLTIPDFANVVDSFSFITLAQTLSNKTLITPTISGTGFTNAQHAHLGATSGGQVTEASISDLSHTTPALTTEQVQDIAGALIATGGTKTRVSVTYQDGTNDFDIIVDDMNDDVPESGDFGAGADLEATGAVSQGAIGNTKLADMKANSVQMRNSGSSGDPDAQDSSDITEDATPTSGNMLLGFDDGAGGVLRLYDVGNLPTGGGGESNTHSSDGGGLALTAATPKVGIDLRLVSLLAGDFDLGSDVVSIDIATVKAWTAIHSFRDNNLQINNPANTFQYIFGTAAIGADRIMELPLLLGNDTVTFNAFAATLTNKTINTAANTITVVEADISDLSHTPAEVNNLETTDPPNVEANEVYAGTGAGAGAWTLTPTLAGTNFTGTGANFTAGNVTTNANLTGHVTSTGNATVLGAFTVAQLSTALSDATISGNNSGDDDQPDDDSEVPDAITINSALPITTTGNVTLDGPVDIGTQETFDSADTTPDVSTGVNWISNATGVTITDFDGTPSEGDLLYIISGGATIFDCTGAGLDCGSTDITTAAGDLTAWKYDGTDWDLLSFMDVSEDNGTDAGGSEVNNLETTDPPNVEANEIYIGTGSGAGAWVVSSGDLTNSLGAFTIADGAVQGNDLSFKMIERLTIPSPNSGDDFPVMRLPYAYTITDIVILAEGGTNWIGGLDEGDGDGNSPTAVDADITATSGTTAQDDGSLTNGGIAADVWLLLHTTSVSGAVNFVSVTIHYDLN